MTLITFAPVNIIHIAYTTLALFSILLIWGKPQYKSLALLLAAHTIQELFNILEEKNITREFILITPAIQLAIGPLYYLFAKNLVYGNLSIRKHLVHLVPAIIALGFTAWWPSVLKVAFVILVIYSFFTFQLLRKYHQILADSISDDKAHSLNWLIRTLVVIFIIEFIDFTRLNLQLTLDNGLLTYWYFLSALISLFCTTYLVIKAVRQPVLYTSIATLEHNLNTQSSNAETSDIELAKTLFMSFEAHQKQTLAYRRSKYSLNDLAEEMGLTEQYTSWVINRGGEKSFSDFINDLRIAEVKKSLASDLNNKNILDIAFDAGFSSKSSFNAVFKKSTGLTPSEYAQQHTLKKSPQP